MWLALFVPHYLCFVGFSVLRSRCGASACMIWHLPDLIVIIKLDRLPYQSTFLHRCRDDFQLQSYRNSHFSPVAYRSSHFPPDPYRTSQFPPDPYRAMIERPGINRYRSESCDCQIFPIRAGFYSPWFLCIDIIYILGSRSAKNSTRSTCLFYGVRCW